MSSSFGSAVINKSSKKFAPKVSAQRKRPQAPSTSQNAPPLVNAPSTTPDLQPRPEAHTGEIDNATTAITAHAGSVNGLPVVASGENDDLEQRPSKRQRVGDGHFTQTSTDPSVSHAIAGTQESLQHVNQEHQRKPHHDDQAAQPGLGTAQRTSGRVGVEQGIGDGQDLPAPPNSTPATIPQVPTNDILDAEMQDAPAQPESTVPSSQTEERVDGADTEMPVIAGEGEAQPRSEVQVVQSGSGDQAAQSRPEDQVTQPADRGAQQAVEEGNVQLETDVDMHSSEAVENQARVLEDGTADKSNPTVVNGLSEEQLADATSTDLGSQTLRNEQQLISGIGSSQSEHTSSNAALPADSNINTDEQMLAVVNGPSTTDRQNQIEAAQSSVTGTDSNSLSASNTSARQAPAVPTSKKDSTKGARSKKPGAKKGASAAADPLADAESGVVAAAPKLRKTTKAGRVTKTRRAGNTDTQATNDEVQGNSSNVQATPAAAKKTRKSRKKAPPKTPTIVVDEEDEANEENSTDRATATENPENAENEDLEQPRAGGRKRAVTPEGAEDIEIDVETTTMFDLCKDTRHGKKSQREAEFQNIDWTEVVKRRKAAEARARAGEVNEQEREESDRRKEAAERQKQGPRGPQLRLVNGQMILDTESVAMSRPAGLDVGDVEAVEESDLTTRINSASWLYANRRDPEERYASSAKSDPWSEDQTDKFYDALRMFGTDFFIISKMFAGKTRRMIKNKFVREERSDPDRIRAALMGENIPMDLAKYCEATGREESDFKDPEQLAQELREQDEAQKVEIEKQRSEVSEKAKSKQEAAKARADALKTKKKRKSKKGGDAGGEEVPMPGEGEVAVAGTAGQD